MNKIVLSVLMITPFITACSMGISNDTKSYCLVLPNVKEYSHEYLAGVAKEVKENKSPKSTEMLKDFKVMRDETRISKREYCPKA